MPSWSACIIARTKPATPARPCARASFLSAFSRLSPIRISWSISRSSSVERAFDALDQPRDRRVEAEPGLDAHGEQVERVRQVGRDPVAARARLHRHVRVGQQVADAGPRRPRSRAAPPSRPGPPHRAEPADSTDDGATAFVARKPYGVNRRVDAGAQAAACRRPRRSSPRAEPQHHRAAAAARTGAHAPRKLSRFRLSSVDALAVAGRQPDRARCARGPAPAATSPTISTAADEARDCKDQEQHVITP